MNLPKTMRCREFAPGVEKFFADPADFVSPNQMVEMAKFLQHRQGGTQRRSKSSPNEEGPNGASSESFR
jgi:hypothetical protein